MKLKKEYLILIGVIVALSAYLSMRSKDQTHFELPALNQVENSAINRIVLTTSKNSIELNKKDDKWYLGSQAYLANSIKVNNMVKAAAEGLRSLSSPEAVARKRGMTVGEIYGWEEKGSDG